MRVPGRNDVTLLAGLAIAALVVFQRHIWYFFQVGREIEEQFGLALVPGLVILIVVFLGNFLVGRIRSATEQRREAEMASTLALGQTLSRTSSMDGVRDALRAQLPAAVGAPEAWVVTRVDGQSHVLVSGPDRSGAGAAPDIMSITERVLARDVGAADDTQGVTLDGYLCFRLASGDDGGVLGVTQNADDDQERRRRLASVAMVIAMATRNVKLLADIEEHGVLDGLTGCFNRTHGMKVLDAELKRAKRARSSFAVVMFDLDYFKSVNDDHGHLCGDALLTAVGKRMQELLRNSDVKCRYGGEEFLVLLPDTPIDGAVHVADVLRQEIAKLSVLWNGQPVSTTASVGVAVADKGELDATALVGHADAALYRAKHLGQNRVCVDGRDDDSPASSEPAAVSDSDEAVPTGVGIGMAVSVGGTREERRGGGRPAMGDHPLPTPERRR